MSSPPVPACGWICALSSPPHWTRLKSQILEQVDALSNANLSFSIEVVGDRPSGDLPVQHELVLGALAALEALGIQGILETGSTDANIPLAAGCPAVTIGITRGGNAHRPDEYIELESIEAGLRQLILLVAALSGINKA